MAHDQQRSFCSIIRRTFPANFKDSKVLDVGSLNINGDNRYLFVDCDFTGIDLAEGLGVDVVSLAHEFDAPDETYDTIISTECFEHDFYYEKSLQNIVRMLKSGGLLVFTCATVGRPEHGTSRVTPHDSPFTSGEKGSWGWYYKNLRAIDLCRAIDVENIFSSYTITMLGVDLQFYGVKL